MTSSSSSPSTPGEREWVCHKPGWMGACSPQSTHHNGFDWGCGWIYFPPAPGEGTERPDTAQLVERLYASTAPTDLNPDMYGVRQLLSEAADALAARPAGDPT